MNYKAEVKKNSKNDNMYSVKFNFTLGELMALRSALRGYATVVGTDVYYYLTNALVRANINLP